MPNALNPSDQKTYQHLSQLSGYSFDRAYSRDMVLDHQKDVREYKQEARNGKDPAVKAWVAKTVKVLQAHLQMARSVETARAR